MKFLVEKSSNLPTTSNIPFPINSNVTANSNTPVKPPESKRYKEQDRSMDNSILKQLETTNNFISDAKANKEKMRIMKFTYFAEALLAVRKQRLSMLKFH